MNPDLDAFVLTDLDFDEVEFGPSCKDGSLFVSIRDGIVDLNVDQVRDLRDYLNAFLKDAAE